MKLIKPDNLKSNIGYSTKYLLLFPTILIVLIWFLPFIYLIYISLLNYNLNDPESLNSYVGLSNYLSSLLQDSFFGDSIKKTIYFTFSCLVLEIILGLFIALLLIDLPDKYSKILITILIIPMVIAPSVTGLIWYFQFNPVFGPSTHLFRWLNFMDGTFLDQNNAFYSISLVDVWQNTPFMILIFYSALKSIPKSIRESLIVDNISLLLRVQKVYLGYILPIFFVAIIIRIIGLLKTFDTIYIITGGGPGNLTETFPLYAQRLNYKEFNFGMGAAQGVIVNYLFLFVFFIIFKKFKFLK